MSFRMERLVKYASENSNSASENSNSASENSNCAGENSKHASESSKCANDSKYRVLLMCERSLHGHFEISAKQ